MSVKESCQQFDEPDESKRDEHNKGSMLFKFHSSTPATDWAIEPAVVGRFENARCSGTLVSASVLRTSTRLYRVAVLTSLTSDIRTTGADSGHGYTSRAVKAAGIVGAANCHHQSAARRVVKAHHRRG